ncbi:hypothetical protein [Lysobacter arvi]|uniref:Uncharacterized protein n=1 Tax=Lysobacter arvi TaxID=3038776 RepID=A0ABU1CA60_9GAMM|nr:hypothetical protein [Lysobacter arvi]MDR0182005.1 hypothetical protein [Lysobacter arvi]
MNDLTLLARRLDPDPFYREPIAQGADGVPGPESVALFDQGGYDLSPLEKRYAAANRRHFSAHRTHRHAIRATWLASPPAKNEGAVLNHALLFERKGFTGEALEQLQRWARVNPLLYKLVKLRPKWGLDFSMDYTDRDGNVFEILHFEYDAFVCEEIQERVDRYSRLFMSLDWDERAKCVLARREEWIDLDFEAQSAWKCDYFGIERERFKMVAWAR